MLFGNISSLYNVAIELKESELVELPPRLQKIASMLSHVTVKLTAFDVQLLNGLLSSAISPQ